MQVPIVHLVCFSLLLLLSLLLNQLKSLLVNGQQNHQQKNGVSLAITNGTGAAINNYQSAYLLLPPTNTTNTRKRYNASNIGGCAYDVFATPRSCGASGQIYYNSNTACGRLRCRLNS